ncbi:heavy metal-associated isoprenylated plant protein 26 [Phtheirospermum japonicum]|uniref:Heavy metal-associated isoprenylated plant protein 26 n=1 Tax=Phtheirospermum japonicum TaxID=374723 RepID=A0A830CK81_9LAMI|nr:heavy metal-associated isoprenylated plant protein 26 [Phtheirospermum japonicum]
MRVHMDCPGCQIKIMKALSKLDGVDNVDIDMNMQKVRVTGWADQDKVLKTIRKTGRMAELWPFPYNPEYHDYYNHYFASSVNYSYSTAEPLASTYNYHKHGYNGYGHGYYQQAPSLAILGVSERAATMFSDDNATGCSVM